MLRSASVREIAKKLVISGDVQKGFKEMGRLGHKDLTLKSIMIKAKFQPLFAQQEIASAQFRLKLIS